MAIFCWPDRPTNQSNFLVIQWGNPGRRSARKLMEVRAYMNGNFHIKFNQDFMLALNIEIGRLQGWIQNVQHAAQEMGEKVERVSEHFNSGYSLLSDKSVAGLLMIENKFNQEKT